MSFFLFIKLFSINKYPVWFLNNALKWLFDFYYLKLTLVLTELNTPYSLAKNRMLIHPKTIKPLSWTFSVVSRSKLGSATWIHPSESFLYCNKVIKSIGHGALSWNLKLAYKSPREDNSISCNPKTLFNSLTLEKSKKSEVST